MAPTVCNKKEPHVRTGTGIRVSTKLLKNSINSSGSSVSGAGKITHRRTIADRTARSRLSARRLPDSESSSSDESEVEDYPRMDEDDNFANKEDAFPPSVDAVSADANMEFASSPVAGSDISAGCQCSDRLTVLTGTTDSAYDSIRCRYCSSPNTILSNETMATTDDVSTAITNGIVLFNRDRNDLSDDSASNYSTYSSAWYSDDYSSSNLDNRYYVSKKPHRNSRALLEIAVKTVKLIKRNQLLQQKLAQLQFETRQFFESVMANPENQNVHLKITTDERKEIKA
ncbi:unnamed protein product [Hermetia illucens]|uniref:Uncharacterized protein n=1 Tax=Hermetia illucens TaxID=343691 RepID=A0A7R8V3U6_HERIL|nr:uncharacterized protein LOC119659509 [Hermetia illucens]CAD7092360.1 unnamed protein product [Hermetia illucens]